MARFILILPDGYVFGCDTTREDAMWRGLKAWVDYVGNTWGEYNQAKLRRFRKALVARDVGKAWEAQQDLQQDYPLDIVKLSGGDLEPVGPFDIEEAFK